MNVLHVMSVCSESLNEHGSGFSMDLDEAREKVSAMIDAAKLVIENENEPRFLYGAIADLSEAIESLEKSS